jgi:hypothetical protein
VPRWRSPHQLTRRGLVPVPSVRQDTGTETDSPSTTIIQSGRAAPRPPIPSQPRARPTAAFTQPTGSRPGRVSKHGLPNAIVPETGTRLYMATLVQREEREREREAPLPRFFPHQTCDRRQRNGEALQTEPTKAQRSALPASAPGGGCNGNFTTRSPRRDKNQARAAVDGQSGVAAGSSSPSIPLLGVRRGEE